MTDKIKRGDALPKWSATLFDGDPSTPVPLTPAEDVRLIGTRNNVVVIDHDTASGFLVYDDTGKVTYTWQTGDTDVAGDLYFEVEVTWPGGSKQTFPVDDYLVTHVYQDQG